MAAFEHLTDLPRASSDSQTWQSVFCKRLKIAIDKGRVQEDGALLKKYTYFGEKNMLMWCPPLGGRNYRTRKC